MASKDREILYSCWKCGHLYRDYESASRCHDAPVQKLYRPAPGHEAEPAHR